MMKGNGHRPMPSVDMDFYQFLKERLEYVTGFYEAVVTPFEERKRLINGNLEPYRQVGRLADFLDSLSVLLVTSGETPQQVREALGADRDRV